MPRNAHRFDRSRGLFWRRFCRVEGRCWLRLVLNLTVVLGWLASAPSGVKATEATPEEFDCVIEPQQTVKLASPVVGVIGRLDVDRGDMVRQGQVVGKLEDGVQAATLALARVRATNGFLVKAAEARVKYLKLKHERITELHSKAIGSLATLQEIQAETEVAIQQLKEAELNREVAKHEVRQAEEVLGQRTLRSPIDGTVVERLLEVGEYQNEQSPILKIAMTNPLRVEAFLPTPVYGRIRKGEPAEVRPEQPFGGTFFATVTVVDRVLDAASGTFGVRLALPNPELLLPGGLRCKIRFPGQSERTPSKNDSTLKTN